MDHRGDLWLDEEVQPMTKKVWKNIFNRRVDCSHYVLILLGSPKMTRDELFLMHITTCENALETMKAKNQDYSASKDPFGNFRVSESFGVPAEIGIIIRTTDKLKRMESFVRRGTLAVKDESIDDTIEDVINYMILLKAMLFDRKNNEKEEKSDDI